MKKEEKRREKKYSKRVKKEALQKALQQEVKRKKKMDKNHLGGKGSELKKVETAIADGVFRLNRKKKLL
jgi:hypothetical protein